MSRSAKFSHNTGHQNYECCRSGCPRASGKRRIPWFGQSSGQSDDGGGCAHTGAGPEAPDLIKGKSAARDTEMIHNFERHQNFWAASLNPAWVLDRKRGTLPPSD
jgi:hypothetical protein